MIDINATSSVDLSTYAIADYRGSGSNIVQVTFDPGITGSVQLLGRVSPDVAWIAIGEPVTASALLPVLTLPYLRVSVTVASGGGGLACIRVRSVNQ